MFFKFQIVMRTNYFLFSLIASVFFISTSAFSQTTNFDETWKEFLTNNKISNMSTLVKPDKAYDLPNYSKYLLMNLNTSFCQSDIEDAEDLMAQIKDIDAQVHKSIPGYVAKLSDLEAKIEAYYSMDNIWQKFLQTKEVTLEELDAIKAAKTSCEKRTLAKYSYMTAYYHFCQGNIQRFKNIFETRTLRLAEKTSLRIEDVEGLASEVARMKSLFRVMAKLDVAWQSYMDTGVSNGFDQELPLFICNPLPNMKVMVLNGATDMCTMAPAMLEEIRKLEAESGVSPSGEVAQKVKELEAGIKKIEDDLMALNRAWKAFIPDNRVTHMGEYGYEYCSKEPLIRAYIMDGFAFVCELAEEMLEKIDSLQRYETTDLEEITMIKINELAELSDQYNSNGREVEMIWNKFVAQGDTLYQEYPSTENYCDNIHQVKDWTINGLCGTCDEGYDYLDKIEEFKSTFEFKFTKDLDCRVQKLRIKVWDCRYKLLKDLAKVEAEPDAYETRLEELMKEYGMGDRPEVCLDDE